MKFQPVNPKENFPDLEDRILEFWKKNKIFEKSVDQRPDNEKYVFYDGPPFITGTPHYGTLLSRIAKDVVPRYWTMNGKKVERQWGWDAHGLPIENKVEAELGIKNRRDIEKVGILKFIESCYEYTEKTSADWEWYKDKIGQWVDFENSYKTMGQDSMESVMWVFKTLFEKDLIYEGVRVSLYCTRDGTPISNFEIAMDNSYEIMNDPAVTVKFPLKGEENTYVLAWTTTPWTLPSNRALVLDENADYVKVKRTQRIKDISTARAVFVNNGKVGVIKYGIDNHYSLPGGKVNEGESPEDALMREMKEETGYQNLRVVRKLGNLSHQFEPKPNTILNESAEIFLVEIKEKDRKSPVFNEMEREYSKMNFEWLDSETAKEKLKSTGGEFEFIDLIEKDGQIDIKRDPIIESDNTEFIILAKQRLEEVFKIYKDEAAEYEIVEEFKGKELVGKEYMPLFEYFKGNEKDFKIYHFEGMANADDGVGIVHSAPGFGEIDTEMGEHYGLTTMFSVNDEGKFVDEVTDWAGVYIKEADPEIILNLKKRNLMFKSERVDHRYPYCYRCHTPLIHKAQNSWYINIDKLRQEMIDQNENINWVPEHIKEGRFKKGLETAPDWGISRTRYWATPMPVWRSEDGEETVVIGSRDELRDRAEEPITKLNLFTPANYENSANGGLTDDGWEQARNIESKYENTLDVIYTGTLERTKQTFEPLANGNSKLEIVENPIFGSIELSNEFNKIKETLFKNNEVEMMSDLPEEVIEGNFNKFEEDLKVEIAKIVKENEGKSIGICVSEDLLPLIRASFQKVTRRVAYRTNPKEGEAAFIFLDDITELDLHRPFIDKFTFKSQSGKLLHRIPEVCDVWLDSGSMPYAMKHYPFEDKHDFENNFPADFLVEYISQTRAWFYVMHVLSTALFGSNSFKNVVVTGVMAGNDGRKMSKSYGNYPDPKETLLKYGADPLRLYFMGSKIMVAEDIAINEEAIKEQIKTIVLPLWNSYSFFVTYANQVNFEPGPELVQNATDKENWSDIPFEPKDKLNVWIISKLQQSIFNIRASFEEYNIPKAVKEYPEFLSLLSKWYIRRSRSKFNEGDEEFLKTLYYVLVEFTKLLAPVAPFLAEEIYSNLVKENIENAKESIHLTDFPKDDDKYLEKHEGALAKMDIVRSIVNLGQSLRVSEGIKVRQPLSEIEVTYDMDPAREIELEEWMKELIAEELNIKVVEEDRNLDKTSGWVMAEDPEWGLKVSLNTNITDELKKEGMLRELQRGIQSQRKRAGLNIEDKADIQIETDYDPVLEVIKESMDELVESVNANSINILTQKPQTKVIKIDGEDINVIIN